MPAQLAHSQTTDQATIVIQPDGPLHVGTVMQFHQQLHTAITSDPSLHLLVDMQKVEYMDSTGVMAIVSAFKLAQKFNKQLSFCSLSHPVRMILELTQLDQVLAIV